VTARPISQGLDPIFYFRVNPLPSSPPKRQLDKSKVNI